VKAGDLLKASVPLCFDFGRAAVTLAGMQTAAAAPSVSSATAFAPTPVDFREASSERIAPYWDEEREEWVGNPTEEEKFAALKALIDEGIEQIEAGQVIEIPHGELRNYIRQLGEEASRRLREQRAAPNEIFV